MENCKRKNTYLIGNISLSNITLVCAKLNNIDQRWIGIVRDRYVKTEQGNGEMISFSEWYKLTYCGIIRVHGGSNFVELVGIPHSTNLHPQRNN